MPIPSRHTPLTRFETAWQSLQNKCVDLGLEATSYTAIFGAKPLHAIALSPQDFANRLRVAEAHATREQVRTVIGPRLQTLASTFANMKQPATQPGAQR